MKKTISIEMALKKLGNTKDQVAHSLLRDGYKGQPNDCEACPVARYLQTKLQTKKVKVMSSSALCYAGSVDDEVSLPKAVRAFISNFDKGKYPKLIK